MRDKGDGAAPRFGQARRTQREDNATVHQQSILVVEDHEEMRDQILIPGLRDCGFRNVVGVGSAKETYRAVLTQRFSLFLVDIGLPDESGFTLSRNLREATDAGIVVLTGGGHTKAQYVQGLDDGADAYLLKPVDMELLAATLRSVLRRQMASHAPQAAVESARAWRLDPEGWALISPGGARIHITGNERILIEPLIARPGNVISREELIARFTHNIYDFDPHRLEVIVHRLRQKASKLSGEDFPLRAVRGTGYVLTSG
ncbi:response regulator transcription factor [Pseudoxanthomonas sp. UTMC 1351]|uniref:response regulator transcription factor n=1 Tax=Pseudoxanthomonas sp. UTMC 1351 TaxID=2695853 RepID=UPI0034CFFA0C